MSVNIFHEQSVVLGKKKADMQMWYLKRAGFILDAVSVKKST